MQLTTQTYRLLFNRPFKIAHGSRDGTDIVITSLTHGEHTGYGEAALPPYLPETQESVIAFLEKLNPSDWDPDDPFAASAAIRAAGEGNTAAKAAAEIAIFDLAARRAGKSIRHMLLIDDRPIHTAYTLSIGTPEETAAQFREKPDYSIYKIKMSDDFAQDKARVKAFNEAGGKRFFADPNQGWKDAGKALEMIAWLKDHGCEFIEQPLPVKHIEGQQMLHSKSALPIFADEAIQTPEDLTEKHQLFHGVNLKLMKCGGIAPAIEMIRMAGNYGMKLMMGCMAESSCGVAAAAQLAPLCEYADLDGPLLIKNDPFSGLEYRDGQVFAAEPLKLNLPGQTEK